MTGRTKMGWATLGLALLTAQTACATQNVAPTGDMAVGPALSVESFLQAANARDLDRMARLFGTADGPVANTGSTFGCMWKRMGSWIGVSNRCMTRQDVEVWMNTIALILQHRDYRLGADQRVPGRQHLTASIPVALVTADGRQVSGVPFTVVQSKNGQWLIEQIALEQVTNSRQRSRPRR